MYGPLRALGGQTAPISLVRWMKGKAVGLTAVGEIQDAHPVVGFLVVDGIGTSLHSAALYALRRARPVITTCLVRHAPVIDHKSQAERALWDQVRMPEENLP